MIQSKLGRGGLGIMVQREENAINSILSKTVAQVELGTFTEKNLQDSNEALYQALISRRILMNAIIRDDEGDEYFY